MNRVMKALLVLTFLTFAAVTHAAEQPATDFTGHYESVKSPKLAFSFDVLQKGRTATTSFSAGHVDGSGAAPDGDGEGQLNEKGELKFSWTDTFDNAGTGLIRRDGKVFQLSMKTTKVSEPRALVFYGEVVLKRTSTKPQMSTR
jgi:hypothetical protein